MVLLSTARFGSGMLLCARSANSPSTVQIGVFAFALELDVLAAATSATLP